MSVPLAARTESDPLRSFRVDVATAAPISLVLLAVRACALCVEESGEGRRSSFQSTRRP